MNIYEGFELSRCKTSIRSGVLNLAVDNCQIYYRSTTIRFMVWFKTKWINNWEIQLPSEQELKNIIREEIKQYDVW